MNGINRERKIGKRDGLEGLCIVYKEKKERISGGGEVKGVD